MKKTYRIDRHNGEIYYGWRKVWGGLLFSKGKGAMMAIDAFYDSHKYRMICEQTGEVVETAGGHGEVEVS